MRGVAGWPGGRMSGRAGWWMGGRIGGWGVILMFFSVYAGCRLLAVTDTTECQHCGNYCQWDDESEWEGQWKDWEAKLSYYDRTYGDLMDEWCVGLVPGGTWVGPHGWRKDLMGAGGLVLPL